MGNGKATHYRCLVSVGILFRKEERGMSFGPGSVVDAKTYVELVDQGFVLPGWFEPLEAEPDPQNESET